MDERKAATTIEQDFIEIADYAHFWNWLPDWNVVQKVYKKFPEAYSVLAPFAYSYLEELIRYTTSEYGCELRYEFGRPRMRNVVMKRIDLAIKENRSSNLK